ncbi:MAG: YkgJ family cysteine cluster protein [Promethearchaeota archaeon]|nr:MAG: YkgJ family cysteine cluster protein [Candidatus Lokiarchaeota archaeon]
MTNNNSETFRFTCTRCGECCTDSNTIVNLTYFDIIRIKEGLKLNDDELIRILGFYVYDKEPSEEDVKKMVISPIKTEKGFAYMALLKRNDGSCYFYDNEKQNCRIYGLRPMFCRTFPFSFKLDFEEGPDKEPKVRLQYTKKGLEYCPGISESSPFINKEEWLDLGKKTFEELNETYYINQKWNDAIKDDRIKPSVKAFIVFLSKIRSQRKKKKKE